MNSNKTPKYKKPKMAHWQVINLGLMLYDVLAVNAAFFLAMWLRFDCSISMMLDQYSMYLTAFLPAIAASADTKSTRSCT